MGHWCQKHDHVKAYCPWCANEQLEAEMDKLILANREALQELREARAQIEEYKAALREAGEAMAGAYD